MTMAALAPMALTWLTWSSDSVTSSTEEAFSPFGPVLSTCPSRSLSAASALSTAAWSTSPPDFDAPLSAAEQPDRTRATAVAASRGTVPRRRRGRRFMCSLSSVRRTSGYVWDGAGAPRRRAGSDAGGGQEPAEMGEALFGSGPGVAVVGVELDDQPAVVVGLADRPDDVGQVQVTGTEREELPGRAGEVLEVHVAEAPAVAADQLGRIAAAGGQVRGVGAEADPAALHQPVELVGALHDGAQVRVVAGFQPVLGGEVDHRVQALGEPLVVLVGGAGGPSGTAAHDQPRGTEPGGQLAGGADPVHLVGQHVRVDEVGAGVDAHQLDAGLGEDIGEGLGRVGDGGQVAVEHLDALVADGGDVPDGVGDRAVREVEEVLDARDPLGGTDDPTPGDAVIPESHRCGPFLRSDHGRLLLLICRSQRLTS